MKTQSKLLKGDCLEVMDDLIASGVVVDAIVTSPPYNIGNMHSNSTIHGTYANNDMNEEEYQNWQIQFLNKCFKILSPTCSLFYNHKVRILNGVAIHPLEWIFKSNFILKQEITWNMKKSANCDKMRFFPFSERIYWLTKDSKTRINNKNKLSDVWDCVPTSKRKDTGHIAVMPEQIALNCLEALDDGLVLDPFMGTGTTGVVCKSLSRDFIGIELDDTYFNLATERIAETKQNYNYIEQLL